MRQHAATHAKSARVGHAGAGTLLDPNGIPELSWEAAQELAPFRVLNVDYVAPGQSGHADDCL